MHTLVLPSTTGTTTSRVLLLLLLLLVVLVLEYSFPFHKSSWHRSLDRRREAILRDRSAREAMAKSR